MKSRPNLWLILIILITASLISALGKKTLKEADLAYSNGNYKEAVNLYEQYLANKPKEKLIPEIQEKISNAYFYLGEEAFAQKNFQEAIEFYKQSEHQNAKDKTSQSYFNLGDQAFSENKYHEAIKFYQKSSDSKVKEKVSKSYFNLGEEAFAIKEYKNAIDFYSKSEEPEARNKNTECHLLIGDDLFSSGNIDDSISEYKSSGLTSDNEELHSRYTKIAEYLFNEKEYKKAIDILIQINEDKLTKDDKYILGCCYFQLALQSNSNFDTFKINMEKAKGYFNNIQDFKDSKSKISLIEQNINMAYEECGCDCAEVIDKYSCFDESGNITRQDNCYENELNLIALFENDIINAFPDLRIYSKESYGKTELEKKVFLNNFWNSEKANKYYEKRDTILNEILSRRYNLIITSYMPEYDVNRKKFSLTFMDIKWTDYYNDKGEFGYDIFWFNSIPIRIKKEGFGFESVIEIPIKYPEEKAIEIEKNRNNIRAEICFMPTKKIIKAKDKIMGMGATKKFILADSVSIRLVDENTYEVLYEIKY